MGIPTTRCRGKFGASPLLFVPVCKVLVGFSCRFQHCSPAAPARMQETWGDTERLRKNREEERREGKESTYLPHWNSFSFKVCVGERVEKKEKVKREVRGEEIFLPLHCCLLTVNSPLQPTWLPSFSPLWLLHLKFSQLFFPDGNVNQYTLKINKKTNPNQNNWVRLSHSPLHIVYELMFLVFTVSNFCDF